MSNDCLYVQGTSLVGNGVKIKVSFASMTTSQDTAQTQTTYLIETALLYVSTVVVNSVVGQKLATVAAQ